MHGLPDHRFLTHECTRAVFAILICLLPLAADAQDEAFLRCADLSDRTERVLCLEDALDAAVKARDAAQDQPAATSAAISAPLPSTAGQATPAAPATEPATNEDRRFDLFGLFDREREEERAREEQRAAETMHATVAELKYYKPDVWTITLDNGQVWRQLYARRYNLREGDAINIYKSGWGTQFRLEAERFGGFIQVERLR